MSLPGEKKDLMMRPPTQVCSFGSLRKRLGDRKDLPIQLELKTSTPLTEVLENLTRFSSPLFFQQVQVVQLVRPS